MTDIGEKAFAGCDSLTSITIGNGVTSIGRSAFADCDSLTSITIPDSVTEIGEGAFGYCSNLTSITIPFVKADGISYIVGSHYYAKNLRVVVVTGGTSIGNSAFSSCTGLTSITIPDSVTSIGRSAFHNCTSLKSITIPDSVTSIGDGAFSSCERLTSITIPDSVTDIGRLAFSDTAYYNNSSYWTDGVLYIGHALIACKTSKTGAVIIKDGTICIADDAFNFCSKLTNITSISFTGTIEQWNAISKGGNWDSDTGSYTVHCTDGDISK